MLQASINVYCLAWLNLELRTSVPHTLVITPRLFLTNKNSIKIFVLPKVHPRDTLLENILYIINHSKSSRTIARVAPLVQKYVTTKHFRMLHKLNRFLKNVVASAILIARQRWSSPLRSCGNHTKHTKHHW